MPVTSQNGLFTDIFRLLLISVLCVVSVRSERRTGKVRNVYNAAFCLSGLILNAAAAGVPGIYCSLAGWAVTMACMYLPYRLNAVGAGDIKMIAAIGAITGTGFALRIIGGSFVVGAALAVPGLFRGSSPGEAAGMLQGCLARLQGVLYIFGIHKSQAAIPDTVPLKAHRRFSFAAAVTISAGLLMFFEYADKIKLLIKGGA